VRAFGVLRNARERALLERCLRAVWAWAAAGALRRHHLCARSVTVLREAAAGAKHRRREATAVRKASLSRRALRAWRCCAEQLVSFVCVVPARLPSAAGPAYWVPSQALCAQCAPASGQGASQAAC
jgi:hypothetical protein